MIDFTSHPEIAPCKSKFDPAVHKTWYSYDYEQIFKDISQGKIAGKPQYRYLCKNDLFFIVYFVMEIPIANHPFIVDMCRVVETGPITDTLDIWARNHFKSTIITQAETIQLILKDPEKCTCILSYSKGAADKFTDAIKQTLEKELLISWFDDILYEKPGTQSSSWSVQNGIRVKRQSVSRPQNTVNSYGLIEGMPTGGHWDRLIFDDTETEDMGRSADQIETLRKSFDMAQNLGMPSGTQVRVIGTYYTHNGLLTYLRDKKYVSGDKTGENMYEYRKVPATDDGTINGKPVFFDQETLDKKRGDPTFNSQQLCNPTPTDEIKLPFEFLQPIESRFLPKDRIKFVLIDPAGDAAVQKSSDSDDWAMLCVSVKPELDDMGTCEVYIEDGVADIMTLATGIDAAGQMYMRNGRIQVLGVEKTANDTTYDHIQKYLRARGRHVKILTGKYARLGSMVLLSPKGREKNRKIEANLSWPWHNSKIYYSTALDPDFMEKLIKECNLFPYFHVNILDALSYLYDLLTDYHFPLEQFEDEEDEEEFGNVIPLSGRNKVGGY